MPPIAAQCGRKGQGAGVQRIADAPKGQAVAGLQAAAGGLGGGWLPAGATRQATAARVLGATVRRVGRCRSMWAGAHGRGRQGQGRAGGGEGQGGGKSRGVWGGGTKKGGGKSRGVWGGGKKYARACAGACGAGSRTQKKKQGYTKRADGAP